MYVASLDDAERSKNAKYYGFIMFYPLTVLRSDYAEVDFGYLLASSVGGCSVMFENPHCRYAISKSEQ